MKIWHLESEYDAFIEAVCSAREGRKADVRGRVAAIKAGVFEKGEAALAHTAGNSTAGRATTPLR